MSRLVAVLLVLVGMTMVLAGIVATLGWWAGAVVAGGTMTAVGLLADFDRS